NLGAPADTTDALAPSLWLGALLATIVARAVVLVSGVVAIVWAAARLEERASFGIAVAVSVLVAPSVFQHYLAIMVLPLLLGLRGRWGLGIRAGQWARPRRGRDRRQGARRGPASAGGTPRRRSARRSRG